jgi:hypothetical protein
MQRGRGGDWTGCHRQDLHEFVSSKLVAKVSSQRCLLSTCIVLQNAANFYVPLTAVLPLAQDLGKSNELKPLYRDLTENGDEGIKRCLRLLTCPRTVPVAPIPVRINLAIISTVESHGCAIYCTDSMVGCF